MKKLRHMEDVKKISELLKKTGADRETTSNPRILICPMCNYPIVCKDAFTDA
jgi:hypothetical protein